MRKLFLFVAVLLVVSMVASIAGCQTAPAQPSQAPAQSSAPAVSSAPAQSSAAVVESAASSASATPSGDAAREEERKKLAQQYKNANPGESFLVGHITFQLEQEYAMMVLQANKQAAEQLGLKFQSALAKSDAEWVQITESMIAAGAKAITLNCPSLAAMPEMVKLCNENHVFLGTYFGYSGDMFPGDLGPYWVVDNTPLSDEQTYLPLMALMEKMKENGKTKLLHHQASKTAATVSTVYINLGVFQAWKNYPEIQLLGHQYGEWGYEGGRAAADASLAARTDYEALWGANDSQTTGALKALQDRGLKIGPYTASRDMEMTTAENILKGDFLCTAGFAIPYYGGRLVSMLYDMCVGEWYPLPDEMLQTGRVDLYGDAQLPALAKASGIDKNPSYNAGPTKDNLEQILKQMKSENPKYPYDFRLISLAKCKELGLTYDRHAGGGTSLGQHDYYFPAKMQKFGSIAALKAHVAALYKYFLDFSWADTWDKAEEYAKQFPAELKLDPVWQ
jgi:ABC-type sugar transport system substrate-binding protein